MNNAVMVNIWNCIKTKFTAVRDAYNARINGDCIVIKDNYSMSGSMFKKSAPDKPMVNLSFGGDFEIPLLKILAVSACVMTAAALFCALGHMVFCAKYSKRW